MNQLTWFLLSNPETNVQICILVKLNSHCTDTWPKTGLPTPQDRFQLFIYIKKIKDTHFKTATLMIWPEKKAGLKENEAISVKLETPSLTRGGGVRHGCSHLQSCPGIPPQKQRSHLTLHDDQDD